MILKLKNGAVLPFITVMTAFFLMFAMLVPKQVIDTYKINVVEEEGDSEFVIPLKSGARITYSVDTGTRPMYGIHVAVAKDAGGPAEGILKCDVAKSGRAALISMKEYDLAQYKDLQYVFFPFDNYEECIGDIEVTFSYVPGDGNVKGYPGLLANGRKVAEASTCLDRTLIDGSLKSMYVYTHDTYPLVYDLKIFLFLFLAASMAIKYEGLNRKKFTQRKRANG